MVYYYHLCKYLFGDDLGLRFQCFIGFYMVLSHWYPGWHPRNHPRKSILANPRRFSRLADVIVWATWVLQSPGHDRWPLSPNGCQAKYWPQAWHVGSSGLRIGWNQFKIEDHWRFLRRYLEIDVPNPIILEHPIAYRPTGIGFFGSWKTRQTFCQLQRCFTVPLRGGVHLWKQQLAWGPRGFWNREYGQCVRSAGRKWVGRSYWLQD